MKSNKNKWIIAVAVGIAVCTVYFIAINFIMGIKPSAYKSYPSAVECINARGISVDEVLFKTETDDEAFLFFTTKNHNCYSAVLSKKYDDNHNLTYKFESAETDAPRTLLKTQQFGNLLYAGVVFKRDIKKYDFEGYIPEYTEITYPVSKGEETVHFYYYDTTDKPHSNINYAPIYGLFDDEDINTVINITDAAFSLSDNYTDVGAFAKSIGASGVVKLPASTENTYDYMIGDNFSVRSFGIPVETVKISTEFGYITLDLKSKSIEAGY